MWVEDDGVGTDPFEVKVKLVIRGDEVIADFTGSSPQVRGPMNGTLGRRRLGGLQRDLLRHPGPANAHPTQLGVLPPHSADRTFRLRRQRTPPGPVGRGQHRPAAETRRPRPRRILAGRAGPRRRRRRWLELQPAFRRRAPGNGALLPRTTTSMGWAPGAQRAKTGTAPRSRVTRIAATRRSRCSSTAIRC